MNTRFMERVGRREQGEALLEVLGPEPCPTPDCDGTGMRVRILDRVFVNVCDRCATAGEAQSEHEAQVEMLLRRSGITPMLAPWSLDTYPTDRPGQAALKAAEEWLSAFAAATPERPCPNLLLVGEVGVGKTGLAWGIVRRLIEREVEARLVNFPDLLDQMREALGKRVPFDKFSTVGTVPVLALDDVGAERPTEWAVSQLLALVDKRQQRRLPTIYTSNYKPDALVERLVEKLAGSDRVIGERIVSRMTDGATQVLVRGSDRRNR